MFRFSDQLLHGSVTRAIQLLQPKEKIMEQFELMHSSWKFDPERQCALLKKAAELKHDKLFSYLYEKYDMPRQKLKYPSLLFIAAKALRPDLICHMIDHGKHRYSEMFYDVIDSVTMLNRMKLSPWSLVLETDEKGEFLKHILEHSPSMTLDEIYGKEERNSLVHLAAEYNAYDALESMYRLKPSCLKWQNAAGESVLSCGVANGMKMIEFLHERCPDVLQDNRDESYKCIYKALKIGLNAGNKNLLDMPNVVEFLKSNAGNSFETDNSLKPILQSMQGNVKKVLGPMANQDLAVQLLNVTVDIHRMLLGSENNRTGMKKLIYNWKQICSTQSEMCTRWYEVQAQPFYRLQASSRLIFPIEGIKALFEIMILVSFPKHLVALHATAHTFLSQVLKQIKESYERNEQNKTIQTTDIKPFVSFAKYITREMLQRGSPVFQFELDENLVRLDVNFCVTPFFLNALDQTAYSRILPDVLSYCRAEQFALLQNEDAILWELWGEAIKKLSQGTQPLTCLCRKVIYHCMGRVLVGKVESLPLPKCLITYMLSFDS